MADKRKPKTFMSCWLLGRTGDGNPERSELPAPSQLLSKLFELGLEAARTRVLGSVLGQHSYLMRVNNAFPSWPATSRVESEKSIGDPLPSPTMA